MKILISGANGYIGSYLCHYLSKHYNVVHGISRNSIIHKSLETIILYNTDILNINNLILKDEYDLLIHLAGANDINSQDDRQALIDTTLSTKVVLDFCNRNNIKKFIYFSTFQVYGTNEGFIDENSLINCKNNYSLTHFFAEQYVKLYRASDLDYIIFRPTNVYGLSPNIKNRTTLVPTCFCFNACETQKIVLTSSGKQYRNFISLEEVAYLTKYMIENFKYKQNNIYNLASNLNLSILEIAQIVATTYKKLFGKRIEIETAKDFNTYTLLEIGLKNIPHISTSKNKLYEEIKKIILYIQGNKK